MKSRKPAATSIGPFGPLAPTLRRCRKISPQHLAFNRTSDVRGLEYVVRSILEAKLFPSESRLVGRVFRDTFPIQTRCADQACWTNFRRPS